MMVLSTQQVREVDRLAIEELGLPGVVLMENAGRHVAVTVLDLLETQLHLTPADAAVAVLCGAGNNGGDGYVIARHLANQGVRVTAWAIGDPARLKPDAAVHHAVAAKMNLVKPMGDSQQMHEAIRAGALKAHVLVDALLGTGFSGTVREPVNELIDACNRAKENGAHIVAVDTPSGLDCDTGQASGAVIWADVTVTFIVAKVGFLQPEAQPYLGEVEVADIGAPPDLIRRALSTD